MKTITQHIDAYLAMRRGMGYQLEQQERYLRSYARYLAAHATPTITLATAMAWVNLPTDTSQGYRANRLSAIRGFAKYLQALEPATALIPADILPAKSDKLEPYVYSHNDIAALMTAAGQITPALRATTSVTLIGLLAATGMRISEALNLDTSDVDFAASRLTIRYAKFDNPRVLPLHATTITALQHYLKIRQHHMPRPKDPAFFVSGAGTRVLYNNFHYVFHQLTQQVGLHTRSLRSRPRIHDLRHTFAITTLMNWHQTGADTNALLPVLSDYLGHISPASTYWYLTATPALMSAATARRNQAGDH